MNDAHPDPTASGDAGAKSAIIDLSILADVIGENPIKLQRFAQKFVESTHAALTELHACHASGDITRIRELGHRIKSSARIVGALGMGELCERLEKLPAAEAQAELSEADALIAQMAALLRRIGSAIATPTTATS